MDGLLKRGGPFGVVDTIRSGRAESPREEYLVEGADVALQLLGGLELRGPSVIGDLGGGARPGIVKEPGSGSDPLRRKGPERMRWRSAGRTEARRGNESLATVASIRCGVPAARGS